MKSNQAGRLAVAFSVILLCLTGCGGVNDKPELGQVTGTITLDGKPLSGIAVVFYPDSGRPARGHTDSEGKYELTYIRDERGTKIGHNRVEVAPNEEGEEDTEEVENPDSVEQAKPARASKSGKPKIPARYNIKTELEADVKPGDNVFNFELTS